MPTAPRERFNVHNALESLDQWCDSVSEMERAVARWRSTAPATDSLRVAAYRDTFDAVTGFWTTDVMTTLRVWTVSAPAAAFLLEGSLRHDRAMDSCVHCESLYDTSTTDYAILERIVFGGSCGVAGCRETTTSPRALTGNVRTN